MLFKTEMQVKTPATKRLKTNEGGTGDRYIPIRESNDVRLSLDLQTTEDAAETTTPFNDYIHSRLLSPLVQRKRVLSFSSTNQPPSSAPLSNYTSSMSSISRRVAEKLFLSTSPTQHNYIPKPSIEYSFYLKRALNAEGVLEDFYSNNLIWSSAGYYFLGRSDESGSSIDCLKDSTIGATPISVIQSESFTDYSLRALEPLGSDQLISSWTEGYLRILNLNLQEAQLTLTQTFQVSEERISTLAAVDASTFFCGDMKGYIRYVDIRAPKPITAVCRGGEQEIAGLKYNTSNYLAAGSNDNQVYLWDIRQLREHSMATYRSHRAAVKGLAFHPTKTNLLTSGGGSACKHLCLWDIRKNNLLYKQSSYAQVTGLHWFPNDPRYFVSSHGNTDPSIKLWQIDCKQQKMITLKTVKKITDLSDDRILSLAASANTNDVAVITESQRLIFFTPKGIKEPPNKTESNINRLILSCMGGVR